MSNAKLFSKPETLQSKVSTRFDGVTKDKYVTYLQLDGSNGALVDLADTELNVDQ